MKKRILLLLCVLALLLSACSGNGSTTTGPAPSADPAPASSAAPGPQPASDPLPTEPGSSGIPARIEPAETEPVETEPIETDTPVTEPPETEPPVTEPPETEPPHKSTTIGGFQVYTDPSQYTPYVPLQAKYTRPTGELPELPEPDTAEGGVYPYIAAKLFGGSGGYTWDAGNIYGLMDGTGTLLTEAIYTEVSVLSSGYEYYKPSYVQSVTAPVWRVGRMTEVRREYYQVDEEEYSYLNGNMVYGIVAMDGSFVLPCEFRGVSFKEDRLFCYRSWETPADLEIYDLSGNLLMTGDRLIPWETSGYTVEYGNGLYLIYCNFGQDREDEYWFADEEGNLVLGPYRSARTFSEGLGCVSEDGTRYGYIDKSGNWVIDPVYSGMFGFYGGLTIQYRSGNDHLVLRSDGTELVSAAGNYYFEFVDCGIMKTNYSSSGTKEFYDYDGNLLFSGYGDWYCLDSDVIYRVKDNVLTLRRFDGEGDDLVIRGPSYVYKAKWPVDGQLTEGFIAASYDERRCWFIRKDLSGSEEISNNDRTYYYNLYLTVNDSMTGKRYEAVCLNNVWQIYGEDGAFLTTTAADAPVILGGLVRELTDTACIYRTLSGEIVFCWPMDTGD